MAITVSLFKGAFARPKTLVVRTLIPASEKAQKLEESRMLGSMAPLAVAITAKGMCYH